ncbi:copper resistance protein NlpE [Chitinophaga qingshengii]|uniref:Copper resistance protein NlpE N-terminal domain-containing protein n=1 Tax=Chitinophaga qingshengii TaxID=1569794 RepID=A0ABR7TM32_9BACT|nr:copper resistance protein NlpE [Chitinophaga qingshengii]MBC9931551.1 copper resistance protein NlpE N-terminal domain-containing protein [Chitinophaga qingshengii]
MKYLLLLSAMALFACQHLRSGQQTGHIDSTATTSGSPTWVTYTGTLPCADCSGILTSLSLEEHGPDGEQLFKLKETYLGVAGKDQIFNSEGNYTVLHGDAEDKDAEIIQLNPDKDRNLQRFYRKAGDILRQLDKDRQDVPTSLDYSLKRVAE